MEMIDEAPLKAKLVGNWTFSGIFKGIAERILNSHARRWGDMNMQQVREMAKRVGAKIANMKKVDAIRAIQLAEGNFDCYGRADNGHCNQSDCCFRDDCLAPALAPGK
jgi:hypothetical protein